jgi:hypothetical protein
MEWLPTHQRCNEAFRLDEEYFVVSLGVFARTTAGHAVMHDVLDRLRSGEQGKLVQKVEREFVTVISKRVDRKRVDAVAAKIVKDFIS